MQWQAKRVHGAWFNVVLDSLGKIHSQEVLRRINITVSHAPSHLETNLTCFEPVDPPEWFSDEKERLNEAFLVASEIAADRSWNQMLFATCLPSTFAGILLDDALKAQRHLQFIHTVWDAVLKAEDMVLSADATKRSFMTDLLSDVAWNQMQICREIYVMGCQCQWQLTFGNDDILRSLAMYMHGCPCKKKFDLEDAFAHLASVSKMTSLATPMNKFFGSQKFTVQLTVRLKCS